MRGSRKPSRKTSSPLDPHPNARGHHLQEPRAHNIAIAKTAIASPPPPAFKSCAAPAADAEAAALAALLVVAGAGVESGALPLVVCACPLSVVDWPVAALELFVLFDPVPSALVELSDPVPFALVEPVRSLDAV